MLSDTRQTITEIAYACGFHDTSYYCRTFKRMKGITPSAVQAAVR
ncbi:MAG: helix-turn-helix domain-containing protein [Eisenbergiella massiliensis]